MIRRAMMNSDGGGHAMHGDFRLRGREVSRLEGFSDAVFGFALTLLVVSLDVPRTFGEMTDMMKDAPAFAICFIFLVHFWFMHYRYFRRFGLSDMPTIILNTALLFVLLMYVYPLKFMFSVVVAMMTGFGPKRVSGNMISMSDAPTLFIVFGSGYVAIYTIYALMYLHAHRKRRVLELSAKEAHETLTGVAVNLACASVGVFSLAIAFSVRGAWLQLAGWCYAATGFVAMGTGMWMHAKWKRIERRAST